MSNLNFCFKTPRQACEAVGELLKDKFNLARRPWNRFRPDNSAWWLVPSASLPHFKHSKYFFKWGDVQKQSILCGYYVEKGLDELVSEVYSSRKAKNLIMTPEWAWHKFLLNLNNGTIAEEVNKLALTVPQIEIVVDGGYVSEPTSFDPYQDKNFGWDMYNFFCDTAKGTITHGNIKREAFVLKLHSVKTLKDLTASVNELSKNEWLWLNVFIAFRVYIDTTQITEKDIALQQAGVLWENFLKYFAGFVV